MNENELYVVKEYKFDNPIITEKDSIIDKCFRDCHNSYFHNFIMNVSMILNLQILVILKYLI